MISVQNVSKLYRLYDSPAGRLKEILLRGRRKYHRDFWALREIDLEVPTGEAVGIIGRNGAGKSTLLRIMAGLDKQYEGTAKAVGELSIGYLAQEPPLTEDKTVGGNLDEAVEPLRAIERRYNELAEQGDVGEEFEHLGEVMAHKEIWELDSHLEQAATALCLPPMDADVRKLSGGERRRVALCRLLLSKPDMLLLDEPTNHLDAESVAWLEHFLQEYPGTVVAVTHDRYFLDNVAGWILELDRGRGIPYQGNYTGWLEQKKARLAVEEKQAGARQRTLDREMDWIKMSPRARQSKSKARIREFEALRQQEEARLPETVEINIPAGPRLGDVVIESKGLVKGYGDRLLIDDLTFNLPAGGIVGVIGANGVGKSTLFRMLVGEEKPESGSIRLGETVKLAYVDQSRDALGPNKSVWEEISGGAERIPLGKREIASRAYVSSFGFKGADQQKRVGDLSGGERNRVHLAKLLKSGGNVLLLDEPTNDLDVDTLRALEDALIGFAGCVVVISHDRWFLDRIATHMLAFEGDSHVEWFEGNYQEYEADYKRRKGAEADQPHRVRFKKLEH